MTETAIPSAAESRAAAACNHFFQNRAAVGAKRALWGLERGRCELFQPVAFLHDEVISEVAESHAHGYAVIQAAIMKGNASAELIMSRRTVTSSMSSSHSKPCAT